MNHPDEPTQAMPAVGSDEFGPADPVVDPEATTETTAALTTDDQPSGRSKSLLGRQYYGEEA